jgi:hypothetical protein
MMGGGPLGDEDQPEESRNRGRRSASVVLTGAFGNSVNVDVFFFLPDPLRWPTHLGFRGLAL